MAMAMEREIIPDAAVGSAPTLDMIRRRPLHSIPQSDGGESHHSLAMSSLAGMQLDQEGIPIARKIADKTFKYFDADENQLSKEEAMEMAGGVVYYQDASNPSKGRLRHRGSFVSRDDARSIASGSRAGSIVSGSRASRRSDGADVRDLLEPLHPVQEHDIPYDDDDHMQLAQAMSLSMQESEESVSREEDTKDEVAEPESPPVRERDLPEYKETTGRHCLVHFACFILLAFLVFGASRSSTSTQLVPGEPKLLQGLDPSLAELLAKHTNTHGATKLFQGLDPGLVELLAKHESTECKEDDNDCKAAVSRGYFLDAPRQEEVFDEASLESRKNAAAAEVERILTSRKVSEILGGHTRSEQRQAFRRIVQLLHPDKGLVASHDARAALALRLAFAARGTSRD